MVKSGTEVGRRCQKLINEPRVSSHVLKENEESVGGIKKDGGPRHPKNGAE